jgi:hypothetical protein
MLRRYFATYDYTEIVMGEPCEFVCETVIEAPDMDTAKVRASRYFEELSFVNGVGWKRVLNRWRIAEAPYDQDVPAPNSFGEARRSPAT